MPHFNEPAAGASSLWLTSARHSRRHSHGGVVEPAGFSAARSCNTDTKSSLLNCLARFFSLCLRFWAFFNSFVTRLRSARTASCSDFNRLIASPSCSTPAGLGMSSCLAASPAVPLELADGAAGPISATTTIASASAPDMALLIV